MISRLILNEDAYSAVVYFGSGQCIVPPSSLVQSSVSMPIVFPFFSLMAFIGLMLYGDPFEAVSHISRK